MTPEEIAEARSRINDVVADFDVETFKRIHRKFFYSLISIETKFNQKFPEECEKYLKELYEEK